MKFRKLERQFMFKFAVTLTVIVVALVAVIGCCFWFFANGYIKEDLYSQQSDADGAICSLVDETAYLYSRIVRSENSETLYKVANGETYGEREEAFFRLLSAEETDVYFCDVALECGGNWYSLSGSPRVRDSFLNECAEAGAYPFVLGDADGNSVEIGIWARVANADFDGTFVFYMSEDGFSSILSGSGGLNFSAVVTEDGYILFHSDKSMTGKYMLTDGEYAVNLSMEYSTSGRGASRTVNLVQKSERLASSYGFDCRIFSVFDYSFFYGDLLRLIYILVGVAVAVLAAGVVVSVVLARGISRPIAKLDENITGTDINGIFTDVEKPPSVRQNGDEIDALEARYDEMIGRIFDLMTKTRDDMKIQRRLELDSMQMQINPHFLYNTLDAVAWMAKIKKEPEIESLVLNLAKFFRLSLHKGDKFITVGEEVELVEHYTAIDAVRFPSRVKVSYSLEEAALSYKTLKLILQPVVENSLKYAFTEGNGNLEISVYVDGEDIVYRVTDDGAGFDAAEVLTKDRSGELGGFGLYNVNERIRLEYGEGYGVEVKSEKGKGTEVTIKIEKRI